ncbi:MAG: phosphoribosyltransferase [Deltaproteobacteria bacterium]|nr:phosphoribosyltransferase [Deltaproteobacteria bacterium]
MYFLERAVYRDREHAGQALAEELRGRVRPGAVVLAVPNGGVAVAAPVAKALEASLGLLVVRKIQIPGNTEAGFGAVAADGSTVLDEDFARRLGLSSRQVAAQREKALTSVRERLAGYGDWAELPSLTDREVVLVDDGLASGATMEAAVAIVRQHNPRRVILAAPTASARAVERLSPLVDELVAPHVGRGRVFAVAAAYQRWYDVSDAEVRGLLAGLEGDHG